MKFVLATIIALMIIAAPIAMASTKYFKTSEDPTFKLKLSAAAPTKIGSKQGYVAAFKDKERNFIPRRFLSPEQALPTALSVKFGEKAAYMVGPRVNVASVSKLGPVKPKYADQTELPRESGVKTIGTFGAKLTSTTSFPKGAFTKREI